MISQSATTATTAISMGQSTSVRLVTGSMNILRG